MHSRAYPFLRLLVPFVTGITLGNYFDTPINGLNAILLLGTILMIPLAIRSYPYRFRWLFGVYLSCWLLGLGYFRMVGQDERRMLAHCSQAIPNATFFIGTVYDAPLTGTRIKAPVRVEWMGSSPDCMQACTGNVLLFIKPDSLAKTLHYGDQVLVRAGVRTTDPPANPHAFDYQRYLHFQNVHYQAFVKKDSFQVLSSGHGTLLWHMAFAARDNMLRVLRDYFPQPDEYAVASALLLGYKEDLSDEIRVAYAETGSMHALAVSGSHVGMLYAGLLVLVRVFRFRGKKGRLLELGLILLVIWAFTFITGATASVLRASVMFSTYLLGKAIYREASAWNVLAFSAFGLLAYNPYLLYDAGFQLSYAAVAGMVFFYPRFYRVSPILPKWADAAWSVLLVGFAAQLGTLPLSLFYFHQFPVYFWLSGWIVVLGGAIFLWGGAVLLVLDMVWTLGAKYLAMGLYYMLWGMNQCIFGIQALPGSVIAGVWVNMLEVILLYACIVCLGIWMVYRKGIWVNVLLVLGIWIGLIRLSRSVEQENQAQLVLYSISKGRLVDFFDGKNGFARMDTLTPKQIQFAAQSHRWASGLLQVPAVLFQKDTVIEHANFAYRPPFSQFFDKRMFWLQPDSKLPGGVFPIDILVVSGKPKTDLKQWVAHYPCRQIVLDTRIAPWHLEPLKKQCLEMGIPCHAIGTAGAFHVKL